MHAARTSSLLNRRRGELGVIAAAGEGALDLGEVVAEVAPMGEEFFMNGNIVVVVDNDDKLTFDDDGVVDAAAGIDVDGGVFGGVDGVSLRTT